MFAPTLWKPATPARRDAGGAMRAGKPDRIAPLFPRYLFVQFRRADNWPDIRKCAGVDRFLCAANGLPAVVPDSAIAAIRGLLAPNDCLYPPNRRDTPFQIGASARLTQGPMADLTGLCTMSDGRRVKLLMTLLGREVTVTVAQSAVEAV